MSQVETKYRRPLNAEQLKVLRLLYWYRFGTVSQITHYLHKKDIKVVQKKLKRLEEQEYVGKRYDKSYKLKGRPAEYCVTPKGARVFLKYIDAKIRRDEKINDQEIKYVYRNKTVSEAFVRHCLLVLTVSLRFMELYGDSMQFFTGMQMIPYDYLPPWRPDGFISFKLIQNNQVGYKLYFIDILDGTRPFFVSMRKVKSYIAFAESGDWPEEQDFPSVLVLCDNEKNESRLRKLIQRILEESYEDINFGSDTLKRFLANPAPKNLWRKVDVDYEDEN